MPVKNGSSSKKCKPKKSKTPPGAIDLCKPTLWVRRLDESHEERDTEYGAQRTKTPSHKDERSSPIANFSTPKSPCSPGVNQRDDAESSSFLTAQGTPETSYTYQALDFNLDETEMNELREITQQLRDYQRARRIYLADSRSPLLVHTSREDTDISRNIQEPRRIQRGQPVRLFRDPADDDDDDYDFFDTNEQLLPLPGSVHDPSISQTAVNTDVGDLDKTKSPRVRHMMVGPSRENFNKLVSTATNTDNKGILEEKRSAKTVQITSVLKNESSLSTETNADEYNKRLSSVRDSLSLTRRARSTPNKSVRNKRVSIATNTNEDNITSGSPQLTVPNTLEDASTSTHEGTIITEPLKLFEFTLVPCATRVPITSVAINTDEVNITNGPPQLSASTSVSMATSVPITSNAATNTDEVYMTNGLTQLCERVLIPMETVPTTSVATTNTEDNVTSRNCASKQCKKKGNVTSGKRQMKDVAVEAIPAKKVVLKDPVQNKRSVAIITDNIEEECIESYSSKALAEGSTISPVYGRTPTDCRRCCEAEDHKVPVSTAAEKTGFLTFISVSTETHVINATQTYEPSYSSIDKKSDSPSSSHNEIPVAVMSEKPVTVPYDHAGCSCSSRTTATTRPTPPSAKTKKKKWKSFK